MNREALQRMRVLKRCFGPDLALEKSIDPESLNWESESGTKISRQGLLGYALLLFLLCPFVCFYLNFKFYCLDVL